MKLTLQVLNCIEFVVGQQKLIYILNRTNYFIYLIEIMKMMRQQMAEIQID